MLLVQCLLQNLIKFALQAIFNREIDLLEEKAVKNPYFLEHINSKKQLIYAD